MDKQEIKVVIESLLFINEKPLESVEMAQVLEVTKSDIESAAGELIDEYKQRNSGICIVKVAGGYQMCTAAETEKWARKMYQERTKQKFSSASLETLAIIAYKQPITKVEIEAIRGVNVDGVSKKLTDLDLIKISGRKEVVGRPFLFVTTRKFLEYFGINTLKDLPKLEDFTLLAEKNNISDTEMSVVNQEQEVIQ